MWSRDGMAPPIVGSVLVGKYAIEPEEYRLISLGSA